MAGVCRTQKRSAVSEPVWRAGHTIRREDTA